VTDTPLGSLPHPLLLTAHPRWSGLCPSYTYSCNMRVVRNPPLCLISGMGLVDLPVRVSAIPTSAKKGGGREPSLRAWAEHIPIVRINYPSPRAGSLGGPQTTRVQRGESATARCARCAMRGITSITIAHAGETVSRQCLPRAPDCPPLFSLLAAAPLRLIQERVTIQRCQAVP